MDRSAVLAFAAVALTLIAIPGPDWAYVLAAGARDRVVAPVVGGIMVGYLLITGVVALGVGPMVAAVPVAMVALTVSGAGYLTYLGIRTFRDPAPLQAGHPEAMASSPWRYLLRGVGVSSLNPKGLLIFLAVLPQFADAGTGWALPLQLATLGGVFTLICGLFYLSLGHAAGRVLGARAAVARITTKVAGAAMILVGLALLAERAFNLLRPWSVRHSC
jgi:threonine/homoserine/homoserine lactone efflux protein